MTKAKVEVVRAYMQDTYPGLKFEVVIQEHEHGTMPIVELLISNITDEEAFLVNEGVKSHIDVLNQRITEGGIE